MITHDKLAQQHAIRTELVAYREFRDRRDDAMRKARELGLTVTEIAGLTGMTRQQVSRIVNGHGNGS